MQIVSCVVAHTECPKAMIREERREAAVAILCGMGKMYELAYKEKITKCRPSSALGWFNASGYFLEFHQSFAVLEEFELLRKKNVRCGICSVMKAMRQLALSAFSEKTDAFISRTLGGTPGDRLLRINYDWVGVFHHYNANAGLELGYADGNRMDRAERIATIVRDVMTDYQEEEEAPCGEGEVPHCPNCSVRPAGMCRKNRLYGQSPRRFRLARQSHLRATADADAASTSESQDE